MKVVLDTNILISGSFWNGDSHKILELWKQQAFTLVVSKDILVELLRVLISFKIAMDESNIEHLFNLFLNNSILIEPLFSLDVCEDKSDNRFIEAAFFGNAKYIISRDRHLLKMKEYKGITILTPEQFLSIIN